MTWTVLTACPERRAAHRWNVSVQGGVTGSARGVTRRHREPIRPDLWDDAAGCPSRRRGRRSAAASTLTSTLSDAAHPSSGVTLALSARIRDSAALTYH